ncbi:BlaI/MecI/CopY family transcriptional regulator [Candidatus Woesearchaeota archaeon]|nr:BlaI/MecI/CopY family transcriptional regulator [Candidatus Woesearchaeota archaeon]
MELDLLKNLGFSYAEAKVYFTLLEVGSVKVGKIIEKSGLQSSTIHNTMHALVARGFVSYIHQGKIKYYQAVDPESVLKSFREKERLFEEALPRLHQLHQSYQASPQAELFEGFGGVMNLLNVLISHAHPSDIYYFFAMDEKDLNNEIQTFFERYDAKRADKGLIVKGLARKELKPFFVERTSLQMRYVSHPIPTNLSICNDQMALITWGKKPMGILIQSPQIISSQIDFFNVLWENAHR